MNTDEQLPDKLDLEPLIKAAKQRNRIKLFLPHMSLVIHDRMKQKRKEYVARKKRIKACNRKAGN